LTNEIYVSPTGQASERKDITEDDAARFWGSEQQPPGYRDWSTANGVSAQIRSGERKPTPKEDAEWRAATRPAPVRTVSAQSGQASGQVDPRVIAGIIGFIGTILLIVGIVLAQANSDLGDLCQSTLGQLGQAFDSTAAAQCAHISTEHTWGAVLIVAGIAAYGLTWLMGRRAMRTRIVRRVVR
jgi:hypothetical protein